MRGRQPAGWRGASLRLKRILCRRTKRGPSGWCIPAPEADPDLTPLGAAGATDPGGVGAGALRLTRVVLPGVRPSSPIGLIFVHRTLVDRAGKMPGTLEERT